MDGPPAVMVSVIRGGEGVLRTSEARQRTTLVSIDEGVDLYDMSPTGGVIPLPVNETAAPT